MVCRASSCINWPSLWTIASIFFSPTISFPTDGRLTKFSLLCVFDRRRERGEQLHESFDNHLIRGFCGSDLGIDLEKIEEVSN